MCRFASVIFYCHVILSFVLSFLRSFSSVIVFCHVLRVLLPFSFVVFIWYSEVVIYIRVLLLTFFDMGEEGHG